MESKRIRVFLGRMPPLLHDIVKDILTDQPDLQLIGDLSAGDGVVDALNSDEIDVMIAGAFQPDDPAPASEVFLSSPRTKVLVIATSGRNAVMHQLQPHQRQLGEVSPQSLLEAIRGDSGSVVRGMPGPGNAAVEGD
jgi:DNA-binding NarL/FixJ family response regulator